MNSIVDAQTQEAAIEVTDCEPTDPKATPPAESVVDNGGKQPKLTTNARFETLLPLLSTEESDKLEAGILADRVVRDPIVVWNDVIVDGHNRHRIATHYGIPFSIVKKSFEDEDSACVWIIENQIGKRNLTDEQRSFQRGELYKLRKKKEGAPEGNRNAEKQLPQNEVVVSGKTSSETAQQIAKEQNVSKATIERDAAFHTTVTNIANNTGRTVNDILDLASKTSKQNIGRISKMEPEQQKAVVAKLATGETKSVADATSESNDKDILGLYHKDLNVLRKAVDAIQRIPDLLDRVGDSIFNRQIDRATEYEKLRTTAVETSKAIITRHSISEMEGNTDTPAPTPSQDNSVNSTENTESEQNTNAGDKQAPILFYLEPKGRGIKATGYVDGGTFVVCKDSQASMERGDSMSKSEKQKRHELISAGTLKTEDGVCVFTKDCPFNSHTQAARIILAGSWKGTGGWQDKEGKKI